MKKLYIITGTSSGLGQAFFELLSDNDNYLLSISRRFLKEQIIRENQRLHFLQHDLNDTNSLVSKIDLENRFSLREFSEIIFFNNAGDIKPINLIGNLPEHTLSNSISVNFIAPLIIINMLAAISLKFSIKLKILNISSGASTRPIAGWGLYCATKSATKMYCDVLNIENSENDLIESYQIDPGVMATPMQDNIRKKTAEEFPMIEQFLKFKSEGRLREPKVVAQELIEEYLG